MSLSLPMNLLREAAIHGEIDRLNQVLQQDPLLLRRVLASGGQNALHVAVGGGHTAFVTEMANREPGLVLVTNQDGCLPLHLACAFGHADMLPQLLQPYHETDPCTQRNGGGMMPLHLAVLSGHREVVEALLDHRQNLSQERTSDGQSVLHLCVVSRQYDILVLLVMKPEIRNHSIALLNAEDDGGDTVLHLAVKRSYVEAVSFLSSLRAMDVNKMNNRRLTAWDCLMESGDTNAQNKQQMADILSQNGARSLTDDNQTPRQAAVSPTMGIFGALAESLGPEWYRRDSEWLKEIRQTLILVCSLVISTTFQVGLRPPGDFVHDVPSSTSLPKVGTSILYYYDRARFSFFSVSNKLALASALTAMLLLVSGLPLRYRPMLVIVVLTMWASIFSYSTAFYFGTQLIKGDDYSQPSDLVPWVILSIIMAFPLLFCVLQYFQKFFSYQPQRV